MIGISSSALFIEYGFMRRAGGVPGAVRQHHGTGRIPSTAPDGLMGDALSHAILPGVAVEYRQRMSLLAKMSIRRVYRRDRRVALAASWVSRRTPLEGRQFCGFYLGKAGARRRRWRRYVVRMSICCTCCLARSGGG